MKKFISAVLSAVLCLSGTTVLAENDKLIAFPGAEGGGMYTTGARGAATAEIYHVTNLNDSGSGSLRDAVSKGNRIIVFDIAGTINLTDYLDLKKDNITILGQTAPGDGICISGAPTRIRANNIIMRYLRFRMGVYDYDLKLYDDDALGGRQQSNIMIDHCSISWSNDECCSLYAVKDSTVQWCIMTEPLNSSVHVNSDGTIGEHGFGGLWGGTNMTYHHNLVSSGKSRFPRVATSATTYSYGNAPDTESLLDVRNNVFYNWRDNTAYGGENMVRVNLVNNYYKEGPASSSIKRFYQFTPTKSGDTKGYSTDLAIDGNYYDAKSPNSKVDTINSDNTNTSAFKFESGVTTYNIEKYDETVPGTATNHTQYIHDYPISTQDAHEAFELVLENAGANLVRDEVDERAVRNARNRDAEIGVEKNGVITGIVNYEHWAALEPIVYSGTRAQDTDNDGMPDTYEDLAGLDKNSSSDALLKARSGYYNIEEYANWLADGNAASEPVPEGAYYEADPVLNGDTVNAAVNNNTDGKAWFITAVYRDNAMMEARSAVIPIGERKDISIKLGEYADGAEVRCYLWSADTLEPYAGAKILK